MSYILESISIVNNNRLFNTTGKKEIFINGLSGKKIISLNGGNGSGKTTLLEEIFPFPIYGRYLKDEIGKKTLTLVNEEGMKLVIEYIFEPNVDTHKCSCYIYKYDASGNRFELNPEGKLGMGKDVISKELGIDEGLAYLYGMKADNISLVNKTPTERRGFMQRVLEDIGYLSDIAKKVNDKKIIVSNMISVNDKSLKSIADISIIESNIEFISGEIIKLREDKISKDRLVDKKTELLSMNDNIQSSILTYGKEIDFYSKKVLPFMAKVEMIDSDANIFAYRRHLGEKIETLELNIKDDEDEILKLNSVQEKIKLKDRLSSLYSDIGSYDREYYTTIVEAMRPDELTLIDSIDLDTANRVRHMFDGLRNTLEKYAVYDNIRGVRNNIGLDSGSMNTYIANMKQKVLELENERQSIIKKMTEFDVIADIKNLFDVNCSGCKAKLKVDEIDNDVSGLHSRLKKIEEELVQIGLNKEEHIRIQTICGELKSVISTMDKSADIKYIYPDWDTWYMIDRNLLEDMLVDINSKIKRVKDLSIYRKLEEYNEIDKVISEMGNSGLLDREVRLEKLTLRKNNNEKTALKYKELHRELTNFVDYITSQNIDGDCLSMSYKMVANKLASMEIDKEKMYRNIENNKIEIAHLQERISKVEKVDEQIEEFEINLNKLQASLVLREKVAGDNVKLRTVQEELNIVHKITSSVLINKVIHRFMYIIKDISNKIYEDINLPYSITDISITDSEFTISILDKDTGILSPDVSCMSSGEKAINGFVLTLALQELLNTKYNIVTLDEVDAALDDGNRVKFVDILSKYVNIYNKQIFIISHNGNLSILNDKTGYIMLNGAKNSNNKNILFKLEGR